MNDVRAPLAIGMAGFTVAPLLPQPARVPSNRSAFRTLLGASGVPTDRPLLEVRGRLPRLPAAGSRPRAWTSGGEPQCARRDSPKCEKDPLDPIHRRRAALAPPETSSHPSLLPMVGHGPLPLLALTDSAPRAAAAASLEELLPMLVRRIAWSGDRRRGSVRLELGAGELAGATVLVHAEAGRVRVHMDVPPGVDARLWQERIVRRLAARGIPTDAVDVT